MGFERPTYRLIFEDEYKGLEVVTKGGNVGEMVRMGVLTGLGEALLAEENDAERKELIEVMGSKLISWNLEDEHGAPVPATTAQLEQEDLFMVISIVTGWMRRGSRVSGPLDQRSYDGVPSVVESMTMEIE
jgi:hypothetical protein